MFVDEVTIEVSAGSGGKGCVAWRREKFVPMGGPDGGDGGRGGNVIIRASTNTDTLSEYSSKKKFGAKNGDPGSGRSKNGHHAEDLILLVPPGTSIYENDTLLIDLIDDGNEVVIAKGGRGGYGNAHFTSSTRQAPDFAELGEPGETRTLKLELKLVADVGIIGFPSVGKSTFIASVSHAKPKIADYPFTTLVPNLGVAHVSEREMVLCDVPGLIEGASEGKGLGHEFLKHIERCGILLHLLDVTRDDIVSDYHAIRKELEAFSPTLSKKKELVALSKSDIVDHDTKEWEGLLKQNKIECFGSISAASHKGVDELLKALLPMVLEERKKREADQEATSDEHVTITLDDISQKMEDYKIDDSGEDVVITGKRIEQFTVMTDFAQLGAKKRFQNVVERIGLLRKLEKYLQDGRKIFIGKKDVTEVL